MDRTQFETGGGVRVTRTARPLTLPCWRRSLKAGRERRGGVLSSGMEYPVGAATAAGTWPTSIRAWSWSRAAGRSRWRPH